MDIKTKLINYSLPCTSAVRQDNGTVLADFERPLTDAEVKIYNRVVNPITWEGIRIKREFLIAACDWTQLPDAVLTLEEKSAWSDYRQALRDIPQDYPTPDDVIFPTPPNEVQ